MPKYRRVLFKAQRLCVGKRSGLRVWKDAMKNICEGAEIGTYVSMDSPVEFYKP